MKRPSVVQSLCFRVFRVRKTQAILSRTFWDQWAFVQKHKSQVISMSWGWQVGAKCQCWYQIHALTHTGMSVVHYDVRVNMRCGHFVDATTSCKGIIWVSWLLEKDGGSLPAMRRVREYVEFSGLELFVPRVIRFAFMQSPFERTKNGHRVA